MTQTIEQQLNNLGIDSHCMVCERYTHWIEFIIRDEHNQPFLNVPGTLIDPTGVRIPIIVGEQPIRLNNLAPGRIRLELEPRAWQSQAQMRKPSAQNHPEIKQWLEANPTGFQGQPRHRRSATMGDFLTAEQNQAIPERHRAKKQGNVQLNTDQSHLVIVQGCNFITLRLGLFFDGTNNHSYSAKWGKQRLEAIHSQWLGHYMRAQDSVFGRGATHTRPLSAQELNPECFDWHDIEGSAANELTNVQKLFDLYQSDQYNAEQEVYTHAQYITGVGTSNSKEIAPAEENLLDKGSGLGDWGVVGKTLTAIEQVCAALVRISLIAERDSSIQLDGFYKLEFDVFGFSRGAAAARHFINRLIEQGEQGEFAQQFTQACAQNNLQLYEQFSWYSNSHCEVTFAGLFDCVAAIIAPLHFDFSITNNDNEPVHLWLDPRRVKRAVHIVADSRTEYRKNFASNRLNSAKHFTELVVPGAHSDIGGGYHSAVAHPKGYLLPVLENKLVYTDSIAYDLFGYQQAKAELDKRIEQALQKEMAAGWRRSDYVVSYEQRQTSKSVTQLRGTLSLKRVVHGELSRVYLRVMYGLAEHAGVPVTDKPISGVIVWHPSNSDYNLYYPMVQTNYSTENNRSINLVQFASHLLTLAKQGEVAQLNTMLSSDDLHRIFMQANLIHHSADVNRVWGARPNLPNKNHGYYTRQTYATRKTD